MPAIAADHPAAVPAPPPPRARRDGSFAAKAAVAAGLVVLGDWLFAGWRGGATIGVYALLLLVALAAALMVLGGGQPDWRPLPSSPLSRLS